MDANLRSCTFEIVVGTYEEFVIGYYFKEESSELIESFAIHSHQGSVRCVCATESYIVSGGTDETIQLYNMISRQAMRSIVQHTGTINSLKFTPEQHHLISSSEDGSIAIHRCGSWQLEKVWTSAHGESGVNCVAIHPSSKLALSLGQNKTLRTWNLVKGRPAYTTNLSSLGKYVDSVVWSPQGSYYAISVDNKICVFDVSTAGVVSTVECTSRIVCFSFVEENIICFGEENGSVVAYDVRSNEELWKIKTGDIRVKCLCCISSKWLVSANSSGEVTVWDVSNINDKPEKVVSANIGCRITCMDVRIPIEVKSMK